MRIVLASGKGGTGKTTLATNLATVLAADRAVAYVDCDVEEPNGRLVLAPEILETRPVTSLVPRTVADRCTGCGACQEACQFNAILATADGAVLVFDTLCHGCGTCLLACPEDALREVPRQIGELGIGRAGEVGFLEGRVNIGEARSTPVITAVREAEPDVDLIVADAPPGATCPTVEAIQDSDLVLLAAEPTPFGAHDLEVVLQLCAALELPAAVVINRADLGDVAIREICRSREVPVLGTLDYDAELAAAGAAGQLAAQVSSRLAERFKVLADKAVDLAAGRS